MTSKNVWVTVYTKCIEIGKDQETAEKTANDAVESYDRYFVNITDDTLIRLAKKYPIIKSMADDSIENMSVRLRKAICLGLGKQKHNDVLTKDEVLTFFRHRNMGEFLNRKNVGQTTLWSAQILLISLLFNGEDDVHV